MTTKLKPCPECESHGGPSGRSITSPSEASHWIECRECAFRGPIDKLPGKAVHLWNELHREAGTATEIIWLDEPAGDTR